MKHTLLAVAATFALALSAGSANAAFVTDGFTNFSPGRADGIVNYAIYDNLAGDFLTSNPGTTFVAQDGAAVPAGRYIYLYQVVNVNFMSTPEAQIEELQIEVQNASAIDSIGYLAMAPGPGTTFVENIQGNIGPGNSRLANGLAADPLDDDAGAVLSAGATIDTVNDLVEWEVNVPINGYSTVLYLTSDFLFEFRDGLLTETGGDNSTGQLPVPTPVPGGIALLLSAIPGLAGLGLVRKFRAQKSAE